MECNIADGDVIPASDNSHQRTSRRQWIYDHRAILAFEHRYGADGSREWSAERQCDHAYNYRRADGAVLPRRRATHPPRTDANDGGNDDGAGRSKVRSKQRGTSRNGICCQQTPLCTKPIHWSENWSDEGAEQRKEREDHAGRHQRHHHKIHNGRDQGNRLKGDGRWDGNGGIRCQCYANRYGQRSFPTHAADGATRTHLQQSRRKHDESQCSPCRKLKARRGDHGWIDADHHEHRECPHIQSVDLSLKKSTTHGNDSHHGGPHCGRLCACEHNVQTDKHRRDTEPHSLMPHS